MISRSDFQPCLVIATRICRGKYNLSFQPTAQGDENLIYNFIPKPDPLLGEIGPAQLPNSLLVLINLTVEFAQDGVKVEEVVAGNVGEQSYEGLDV